MSDALDNSFATEASTYNDNDSGNTGGEGGLVDLSAVGTVAAAVGGGEVHSVNSSDDSSDDEESKESVPLFGVDLVNKNTTMGADMRPP